MHLHAAGAARVEGAAAAPDERQRCIQQRAEERPGLAKQTDRKAYQTDRQTEQWPGRMGSGSPFQADWLTDREQVRHSGAYMCRMPGQTDRPP
jgi:hypothetical protein